LTPARVPRHSAGMTTPATDERLAAYAALLHLASLACLEA
jgi:hypothetical protein